MQNCETPESRSHQMSEPHSNDSNFMMDRYSEPTKDLGGQNCEVPEPQPLKATEDLFDDNSSMMDEDIQFSQSLEMQRSQTHYIPFQQADDIDSIIDESTMEQDVDLPLLDDWQTNYIPFQQADDTVFIMGESTMEQGVDLPLLNGLQTSELRSFQMSDFHLDDAQVNMHQISMNPLCDEPFAQGQEIPKPQSDHILGPLPDDNGPIIDQPSLEKLQNVPYMKKWDVLKPALEDLYLHQGMELPDIMDSMKNKYNFDANLAQYKYQFRKKWNWKKNIPAAKKIEILELGQQRAHLGKRSIARFKGKNVDPKKLRRYKKHVSRQEMAAKGTAQPLSPLRGLFSVIIPFQNRIFLSWSAPFGAGGALRPGRPRSSFTAKISNPSDVSMRSLTEDPGELALEESSLFARRLEQKLMEDRLQLFIRGEHVDLSRTMNRSEIRITSIWLYQFWFFGFKIAKNWRYGSIDLKAKDLGFLPNQELGYNTFNESSSKRDDIQKPSNICYWTQHIDGELDVYIPPTPLEDILRTNLETNNFSSYPFSELPLKLPQFAKKVDRSPSELLEESLGFAIMAGNIDLVSDLLSRVIEQGIDISKLYPYHLAVTYLYGGEDCCNTFSILYRDLSDDSNHLTLIKNFVNDRGHTVIDSLMITILRSHTSTRPGMVDSAWSRESHFTGEEVDICGRWDAESSCYRALLAAGENSVPFHWKHKFCHTSAQVVSHCLRLIELFLDGWWLSRPSGLFIKYCSPCGKQLTLLPLHTLVIVAFHLAHFGFEGEDLFGIIACLIELIFCDTDPNASTEVSVNLLLGIEIADNCDHIEMSPLELAKAVPISLRETWSTSCKAGWEIMCHILQQGEEVHRMRHDSEDDGSQEGSYESEDGGDDNDDGASEENNSIRGNGAESASGTGFSWRAPAETAVNSSHECWPGYTSHDADCFDFRETFGENKYLGHIKAAIYAELLTYRRVRVTDPWLSKYFNMDELLHNLKSGSQVSIGYVRTGIMTPYCGCGEFHGAQLRNFPTADEATTEDISNMDWEDEHAWQIPLRLTIS